MLDAVAAVPREAFVPAALRPRAWDDEALSIEAGQTISQPSLVARMCDLLELGGSERLLDVGTGSGYHAAVLARLAARVWSVETIASLSQTARERLRAAGTEGVECVVGDGTLGLSEHAPFDAINVAAAGPQERLEPLIDQLAPGGRLIAPVQSDRGRQVLTLVRRDADGAGLHRSTHGDVRFVALTHAG